MTLSRLFSVLNVNNTLDLESGGGTAERTFQMSRFLARQEGVLSSVLTIDLGTLDARRVKAIEPAMLIALPCLWKRFYLPRTHWKMIQQIVNDVDLVHLMGHWSVLNAMVYLAIRFAGKPYVVCPAGALPVFGRSKWLKRIYNLVIGKAIIRNASGWIAVTEKELSQFEDYGVNSACVTVIPNGVNEDDFPIVDIADFKQRYGLPDAPIILFMGRLNQIKGPDLLLEAFLKVRHSFPEHHLVFAGPDGGMLESLRQSVERSAASECVHFIGYVGGAEKSAAYRMASLLVVPSRQEAMSIVAVEAGICGVPVLLTDQCGFSNIRSIDSRLEVPASVSGIADGLVRLLEDQGSLDKISPVWSCFVRSNYAWSFIVYDYMRFYQKIIGFAEKNNEY